MNSDSFLPNETLIGDGRYKIVKVLGKGGFGAVYLVQDTHFENKFWALKELLNKFKGRGDSEYVKKMFYLEANILSQLNHPGIPKISDFFVENERLYVVMEYIKGITLAEYMEEGEKTPEEDILKLILKVTGILSYLHSQKPKPIVFRDLKPKNIMLSEDNSVYLIDFGLARLFDSSKEKDTIAGLSQGYAPPEQYPVESRIPGALGKSEPRSDIYALGATIHHLLTGIHPRTNPFSFEPISKFNKTISKEFEHIIFRCLEYNMEKRYQSVDELSEELNKFIEKKEFIDKKQKIYDKGLKYEEGKKFEDALFSYKQLLELFPEDSSIYFRMAFCYEQMGAGEMAKKYYDNYNKLNKNQQLPCPYCNKKINFTSLCSHCKNQIKICSKCRILNRLHAKFCRVCGCKDFTTPKDNRHYEELVKKYPPVSLNLNLKLYKKAIEKYPQDPLYNLGLAETYDFLEKDLEALRYYKHFISLSRDDSKMEIVKSRVNEIEKTIDATIADNKDWHQS